MKGLLFGLLLGWGCFSSQPAAADTQPPRLHVPPDFHLYLGPYHPDVLLAAPAYVEPLPQAVIDVPKACDLAATVSRVAQVYRFNVRCACVLASGGMVQLVGSQRAPRARLEYGMDDFPDIKACVERYGVHMN